MIAAARTGVTTNTTPSDCEVVITPHRERATPRRVRAVHHLARAELADRAQGWTMPCTA